MEREAVVTLYTRHGCGLCEKARHVLERARQRASFRLEVVDIDRDEHLRRRYGDDVPVIAINGREAFRHRLDEEAFLAKLRVET
ncbi:MAG: glutaredoxin family protein [Bryobacteraceae bacterium]|jgi:glutaredoxin|nr:glutaredoxin family protein [Bryobacteraceae bacterium]